ncbi:hypothetical protein [Sphingomonas jaspsi]|uniref:hypothetical protein n=1 Tax=Sphingomonas jaspsi TaxID=392409 RepID=UPI0004AE335C|nr:hypothetical protein [Sphingomonas jaspsi]
MRSLSLLLPALFGLTIGTAEPTWAKRPAASPFLGLWELDLGKMPVTYGTPPKRVTYRFVDVGGGQWQTKIDITAQDDSVRHMEAQFTRDGSVVASAGNKDEGDHAAAGSPAPNVLVLTLAKAKQLESVRVYAVSADGKTMTESAADVDDEGVPFVRNFTFHRVAR